MKKLIVLVLFLNVQYFFAQKSFTINTYYSGTTNSNIKEEHFLFTYDQNIKMMNMLNVDNNYSNNQPVLFVDKRYLKGDDILKLVFVGDRSKKNLDRQVKYEIPAYSINYDTKLDKVIYIEINYYNVAEHKQVKETKYFFTEYGIKYLED